MENHDMQLTLKGDTFLALQDDFDAILNRTIGNMEMKSADEATLTLKLKITLEKRSARSFSSGFDSAREIIKPAFAHEISSVMQVKDKKSGALTGDYELMWDEMEGKYVMRCIDDGQVSMDDVIDADYTMTEQTAALPADGPRSHPAPQNGVDREDDEDDEDGYSYDDPEEE